MDNENALSIEEQLTAAVLVIESMKSEREKDIAALAAKDNELAAVYKVNEELKEEIEKLTAKGTQPVVSSLPFTKETFELDGVKYGFAFGATMYKGQKITPVEIMADAGLQAELVKINAGILKKQ